MAKLLTPQQIHYLKSDEFVLAECDARWPGERTKDAWSRARLRYQYRQDPHTLYPKDNDPSVEWDKRVADVDWREYVRVYAEAQELNKRESGSQDTARIRVTSTTGVPIGFVSDFHFGSWGTSMTRIEQVTDQIQRLGLRLAVLGDMVQMAIRLRGVLEISDNMLTPRQQVRFLESWLEELAPQILWSTWDNHAVQREEDATGFSYYADLFKRCSVYHSGIGHVDLEITDGGDNTQTYKIASSHKFRGNTPANPLSGSIKYMRTVGIDRELVVAGDSHCPELRAYVDGPLPRLAINCGTLQTDSGYAKRFFTPYSHEFMPVVVFHPDQHQMIPFKSLDDYERRATS